MNPFRLAGPVFEFELLTTSRRGRYYVLRSAYALVLLYLLWQTYEGWTVEFGTMLTPSGAARFALTVFAGLSVLQEILVLVLTPAMVAGVIAVEKQSKTLHYVLASPLSSFEVVVGKLMSRMLYVGVFLGVGLPVSSLLVLMGGIDPRMVLLGCGVAVSSAWFLAGLSVLCSVTARRVRDALMMAYALELLWLFAPWVARQVLVSWPWSTPQSLIWVTEWLDRLSPLTIAFDLVMGLARGGVVSTLIQDLLTLTALQAVGGVVFVGLAVWRLRPVFKAQGDAPRRPLLAVLKVRGSWGPRRRPPVSDYPLDWQESHTARGTRLSRAVGRLVTFALGVPLLYWTCTYALPAFYEAWDNHYVFGPVPWAGTSARWQYAGMLAVVVTLTFLIGMFQTVAAAAASITTEHEDDTWTSLTATDLTGREIVGAKFRSALRGPRWIWLGTALLVASGVACGSLHPLSFAFVGLAVAAFAAFAAALGVFLSSLLKSTWRAQFLAFALLTLVNLVGQSALNTLEYPAPLAMPGFMPIHVAKALVMPDFPASFAASTPDPLWINLRISQIDKRPFWLTVLWGFSVISYGSLAVVLVAASLRGFERAAGRPRRPVRPRPRPEPATTGRLAAAD